MSDSCFACTSIGESVFQEVEYPKAEGPCPTLHITFTEFEKCRLGFAELSEEEKTQLTWILIMFLHYQYRLEKDTDIVYKLEQWFERYRINPKSIYELLKVSLHIPKLCLLRGYFLHHAIGVKIRNRKRALRYYKFAAHCGDSLAASYTGILLFERHGIEAENCHFEYYFRQSAILGHPKGMQNYGELLMSEFAKKKNMKNGLYWVVQATKIMYPPAFEYLATCYERGDGTYQDQHHSLLLQRKLVEALLRIPCQAFEPNVSYFPSSRYFC
ncbi:hypothetical protein G9A89_021715 [Geosiphon pyriformis]|nr:hypothetical protein G9A89_021715 [Geosiphon pyriformis]